MGGGAQKRGELEPWMEPWIAVGQRCKHNLWKESDKKIMCQSMYQKYNFGPDAGCDKTHYVNESLHFFPSRSFDFHPKLKEKNELVKIS